MEANLKIFFFLAFNIMVLSATAQKSVIYYSFPDKVDTKLSDYVGSYLTIYKKIDTNFRVYLVVSNSNDTTQILVTKFNIKDSAFNIILDNTNRFYKAYLKSKKVDIPIVFETDFSLSDLLHVKEVINGKPATTHSYIFRSGHLLGFTVRRNVTTIVIDKITVD